MNKTRLIQEAKKVLSKNDLGGWTRPTPGLYPHLWLWDSCFIAIGLRHINIERAKEEMRSIFRSQWRNGMLPHIVFSDARGYHAGPELWRTERSPNSPDYPRSTGISQPPMVAEAVIQIGEKLSKKDRIEWYKEAFPYVLKFHEWLYRDRDPDGDGIVTVVHSWESGMDNSPPWMHLMHNHITSKRVKLIKGLNLDKFIERFRKDTKVVPAEERISTIDLQAVYAMIRSLSHYRYDDSTILKKQKVQIDDITYNAILIRANQHLETMAKDIGEELPYLIKKALKRGVKPLDALWDDIDGEFYPRNANTNRPIRISTISTFLPLYAGHLPKSRVKKLIQLMQDPDSYGTKYPIPSTPINSPYFKEHCYWQGPTWVQMNWLIIDGLRRNSEKALADKLEQKTLELVSKGGMYEYFSPIDGSKAGAPVFSWTAALTIDMLERSKV